jgi:hypothetical protein
MRTIERQVVDSALGLIGAAIGTAMLQQGMKAAHKLPPAIQPESPVQDPGEFVVQLGERAASHALPEGAHRASVMLSHYVYGAMWGAALGFAFGRAPIRSGKLALASGAALGALVWVVGDVGWLPAAGLTSPVTRQKPGALLITLLSNVLYGVVAAVPIAMRAALMPERRGLRALLRF